MNQLYMYMNSRLYNSYMNMFKNAINGAKELTRVNRTYDPVFNLRFFENMRGGGVVLYNMEYQMIELFIPLQLKQVFMRTKRRALISHK